MLTAPSDGAAVSNKAAPQDDSGQNVQERAPRTEALTPREVPLNEIVVADRMHKETREGVDICFVVLDGTAYLASDSDIEVPLPQPLKEGGIYAAKVRAVFKYGGIEGAVDHLGKIESISDVHETAVGDLGLKDISESARPRSSMLGGYSEGEFIFVLDEQAAVWKDGEWLWRYAKANGKNAATSSYFHRDGVAPEQVSEGAGRGIVACEDYFVWPGGMDQASESRRPA